MATQQQTDEKSRTSERNEQGGQQQARGQGSQGQQSQGQQQSREQGSRGSQQQRQQGSNAIQRQQSGGAMAPFAFGPFALIRRMQEDIDRLFGGVARGQSLASRQSQVQGLGEWSPAIETFQRGNEFVIRADLPGLTADDVTIEVGEDEVVITGERRYEHEEEREGVYVSEVTYGGFTRVVPLPPGAIADNAKATFNDGVLEIVVPAPSQEARRGRRIEIQQGSSERSEGGRQQEQRRS
jgi:HSP20 family protein